MTFSKTLEEVLEICRKEPVDEINPAVFLKKSLEKLGIEHYNNIVDDYIENNYPKFNPEAEPSFNKVMAEAVRIGEEDDNSDLPLFPSSILTHVMCIVPDGDPILNLMKDEILDPIENKEEEHPEWQKNYKSFSEEGKLPTVDDLKGWLKNPEIGTENLPPEIQRLGIEMSTGGKS